jgi:hypothetical protein
MLGDSFTVNYFKCAQQAFRSPDSEASRRMPASNRRPPGMARGGAGGRPQLRVYCQSPREGRPQREGSDLGRAMFLVGKWVFF